MRCGRSAAWLLRAVALALAPAGGAAAQERPGDLPALLAPAPAPYPETLLGSGARGTVELTLEVDGTGQVLDAGVLGGRDGPLERAARAAALRLRFAPGRSGRREGGFSATVAYTFPAD